MKEKYNFVTGMSESTTINDIKKDMKLGVKEFYFGFIPAEWSQKYGFEHSLNRRFKKKKQFTDLNYFIKIAKYIKRNNGKVSLTLNEHVYTGNSRNTIKNIINNTKDYIDSIIVSEFSLVLFINKYFEDIKIIIGSDFGVLNNETVNLLSNYGVIRIILPPECSYKSEIKDIILQNPNMDFEIFVFGVGCTFCASKCFNFHYSSGTLLCKHFKHIFENFKINHAPALSSIKDKIIQKKVQDITLGEKCGLCYVNELYNLNRNLYFKIPVRVSGNFSSKRLLKYVLDNNLSKEQIIDLTKCQKRRCYNF